MLWMTYFIFCLTPGLWSFVSHRNSTTMLVIYTYYLLSMVKSLKISIYRNIYLYFLLYKYTNAILSRALRVSVHGWVPFTRWPVFWVCIRSLSWREQSHKLTSILALYFCHFSSYVSYCLYGLVAKVVGSISSDPAKEFT